MTVSGFPLRSIDGRLEIVEAVARLVERVNNPEA